MKASNVAILILLLLCLIFGTVIVLKLPCKCGEPANAPGILKQLQAENDSLNKSNAALDQKLLLHRQQTDSIQQCLLNTKQNYEKLKQKQHESISHLDSLNGMGLYSFFSDFKP